MSTLPESPWGERYLLLTHGADDTPTIRYVSWEEACKAAEDDGVSAKDLVWALDECGRCDWWTGEVRNHPDNRYTTLIPCEPAEL